MYYDESVNILKMLFVIEYMFFLNKMIVIIIDVIISLVRIRDKIRIKIWEEFFFGVFVSVKFIRNKIYFKFYEIKVLLFE